MDSRDTQKNEVAEMAYNFILEHQNKQGKLLQELVDIIPTQVQ